MSRKLHSILQHSLNRMNCSFKRLLEPMTFLIPIPVLAPTARRFSCNYLGLHPKRNGPQNSKTHVHFVLWSNLNECFFLFADGSRIQPTSILRGSRGRGGPLRPFGQGGPVGLCPSSLRLDRCMLLSAPLPPLLCAHFLSAPRQCGRAVCTGGVRLVSRRDTHSVEPRCSVSRSEMFVQTRLVFSSALEPPVLHSVTSDPLDAAPAPLCFVNKHHLAVPIRK